MEKDYLTIEKLQKSFDILREKDIFITPPYIVIISEDAWRKKVEKINYINSTNESVEKGGKLC